MPRPLTALCLLIAMLWSGGLPAQEASEASDRETNSNAIPGEIEAVTVYRGQAQVTRVVPVSGAAGAREVVVGPLPAEVTPDSLFAEAGEGVSVRAVEMRSTPVGQEPREQVRDLDEQMQELRRELQRIEANLELVKRNRQSTDKLDALIGPSTARDAAEGKLTIDAETITQLTTFTFEQRQRLTNEELELQNRRAEVKDELEQLQRERNQLSQGRQESRYEAVLFLDKAAAGGEAEVRLTYLVRRCNWWPAYNVRAEPGGSSAEVELNALITQMSGEDWSDVELTLSTANPALSAAAPALAAFHVKLKASEAAARGPDTSNAPMFALTEALSNTSSGGYAEAQQMRRQAAEQVQEEAGFRGNISNSWRMNLAGSDLQLLEQVLPPAELERLRLSSPEAGDAPSLTYAIDGRLSVASRRDQQIVRVASTSMPASFHHVAMPVLTRYVYREAELENDGPIDLLGGSVDVYLDERFVGRTEIPTVARGQSFMVGFGADPQLRAEKTLVERDAEVRGGNQVVELRYELRLENYKDRPVTVWLKDRLPYSRDGGDLGVVVTDMPTDLSDDPVYRSLERPRQILRWDVEVPAGAAGGEAATVEYAYQIAYDRQLTLSNPLRSSGGGGGGGGGTLFGDSDGDEASGPANEAALREFEALEKARQKR